MTCCAECGAPITEAANKKAGRKKHFCGAACRTLYCNRRSRQRLKASELPKSNHKSEWTDDMWNKLKSLLHTGEGNARYTALLYGRLKKCV